MVTVRPKALATSSTMSGDAASRVMAGTGAASLRGEGRSRPRPGRGEEKNSKSTLIVLPLSPNPPISYRPPPTASSLLLSSNSFIHSSPTASLHPELPRGRPPLTPLNLAPSKNGSAPRHIIPSNDLLTPLIPPLSISSRHVSSSVAHPGGRRRPGPGRRRRQRPGTLVESGCRPPTTLPSVSTVVDHLVKDEAGALALARWAPTGRPSSGRPRNAGDRCRS